ncbi:fungal-specific transcription factor domain-containing protein [Ilyonectria sp. MPI-CAGE-AT-0026]|nr:fungal-specific transcription factor domain-containing protein [Ilyonectria sp. MPI-CAGE-AT-0026]
MASADRPRSNVCFRCAEIKQACDGKSPCSRCARLSLPCRPKDSTAAAQHTTFYDPSAEGWMPLNEPKARIRRVQTGCLMCKKRKKKCDERKPRCGDCGRLCLDCSWPPEREQRTRRRRRSTSPGMEMWAALGMGIGMNPDGSQSLPSSTEMNALFGSSGEGEMPGSGGQLQTGFTLNGSEMGFRASVDDISWEFPASPGWLDLLSETPAFSTSPSDSMVSESLSLYVPSLTPDLTSPDDKALLNHYSTIVATILSRRADVKANPYTSYLLPMALSNDLVLHCVLALSAKHWHKLQPRMGNRGLLHQSKATQSLAGLLPHVNKASADIALVSSLLLCMTELFDGKSTGWKLHLKGAKRLLGTLISEHGDALTGNYKFLVRLSRFLDSATTTSTCMPPLIEEEEGEGAALDRLAATPDDEDTAVYGIPKELFHLVDRVNSLANKRKNRVDDQSEAEFRNEASIVEEHLDRWSFEYGGLSRAVSTRFPSNDDVLHATTAYEWALRLRLHQITDGYTLTDPKVSQAVEGILASVQKIRYGSALEGCLLFPLVMAGGACDQLEHRVIIQDRLMVMERTYGFGYIYHSRELVERVWDRRDKMEGTGAIINWARLRFEEMSGLVVF